MLSSLNPRGVVGCSRSAAAELKAATLRILVKKRHLNLHSFLPVVPWKYQLVLGRPFSCEFSIPGGCNGVPACCWPANPPKAGPCEQPARSFIDLSFCSAHEQAVTVAIRE